VATDGRRVVALGRRIGGTHGNPRFTSWTGRPDRLHETQQPFELFGGPDAIAVTDLAMTDDGGVVIGAWAHHGDPSGVTVWMQDGETWRRFDEAPGIASEVTDVGSDLTSPAAITARGGEPVLVGWTVHLADGRVGLRASLWEHEGTVWHEVRLAADGDAVARALLNQATAWQLPGRADGTTRMLDAVAPDASAMLYRMRSRRPTSQMPPLGTKLKAVEAIAVVAKWLEKR
jgi:hypothetical protein